MAEKDPKYTTPDQRKEIVELLGLEGDDVTLCCSMLKNMRYSCAEEVLKIFRGNSSQSEVERATRYINSMMSPSAEALNAPATI